MQKNHECCSKLGVSKMGGGFRHLEKILFLYVSKGILHSQKWMIVLKKL